MGGTQATMNKIKIRYAIAITLALLAWPAVCQAGTHNHLANRIRTMSASQLQSSYSYVISADVASSVTLPDGRILWLAGDASKINGQAVLDPHNEFVIQAGPGSPFFTPLLSVAGNGRPAGQYQQVPNFSNGDVFWPSAGAVDLGVLHVFGVRVTLGTSAWDITVDGYYDATFSLPGLAYQGIAAIPAGVSSVAQGTNGWWLIGTDKVAGTCYSDCYTAHSMWAGTGHLGDYASWTAPFTFLGAGFNLGGVVDLYRRPDNTWTAWTKTDDIMGSTIQRMSAPHLENGPWALDQTWPVPVIDTTKPISYGVRVHPGQGEAAGTQLVTVIENDASFYGPLFLELPDGS